MYKKFHLYGRDNQVIGYDFVCDHPEYVVILIHGIGEHAGRYKRVAARLNERNITVMSMDLRGHGDSAKPLGHCAPRGKVLKDIDELILRSTKKYPDIPIVVYGHSMGGNIVLDYRARGSLNNVPAGYIVSAPWIKLVRTVSGPVFSTVRFLSKIIPEFAISSECKEEDLGNPDYVKPYKDDPKVHPKISLLTAYEGYTIGTALMNDTNEKNGKAKETPCLLMHGDNDKLCDIEGSRAFAEHEQGESFTYIEWPGYSHELHNGGEAGQTGDEVIDCVIEFIEGL